MARKYNVESVAIVRITTESLSALIPWKMHQTTTMNADRSRCFRLSAILWVLWQWLGRSRLLTKHGTKCKWNQLELELWNQYARIESLDRDRGEVEKPHRLAKDRYEGYEKSRQR